MAGGTKGHVLLYFRDTKSRRLEYKPEFLHDAQKSAQELYSTILSHGKGKLRKEYLSKVYQAMSTTGKLNSLLLVFPELDGKTEKKFRVWRLVIL